MDKLKMLAEWYGCKSIKWTARVYYDEKGNEFHPDRNSNQLDMLEDKMIEELRTKHNRPVNLSVGVFSDGETYLAQVACGDIGDVEIVDYNVKGKTKNEARLNAIINYVEQKL